MSSYAEVTNDLSSYFVELNFDQDVDRIEERQLNFRCGEYRQRADAHTGLMVWYRDFCKHPRECPICRERKEQVMRERLTGLLGKGVRVMSHTEDIASMTRQHGAANIINLPGKADNWLIIQTSDETLGQELTPELIEQIIPYAVPPEGRRVSGKLGKGTVPKLEDDREREPITQRAWVYEQEITNELRETIEEVTIEETLHLDPKTAEEAQWAVYEVEEKAVEVAARYGVKILFLYTEVNMIYLSRLDWSKRREWLNRRKNAPVKSAISGRNL